MFILTDKTFYHSLIKINCCKNELQMKEHLPVSLQYTHAQLFDVYTHDNHGPMLVFYYCSIERENGVNSGFDR